LPALRTLQVLLATALVALIAACATVPPVQLAFAVGRDGSVAGGPLPCARPEPPDAARAAEPLPDPALRVLTWNLHKNGDPGWDADLARFAAVSDLLLIQEAALTADLRKVLADGGFDALLASSFRFDDHETGVLSAARVRPASACVQRHFEPLLALPKSAVIAHYSMRGTTETLAVANVHAINFVPGLDSYRAQLEALADELAAHGGPMILAGDFNTWSLSRVAVVDEVMRRLGLTPVMPPDDGRSRFFGQQVDFVFVRGFEVVRAEVPEVATSDHNPILVTLRRVGAAP
jgi:endonuclease/exonuclease/phosphatase (EEP) superfamily protein YafD